MPEIDNLSISITANAQKANAAIDNLITKLDRLATSLGKVDGSNLSVLANGVNRLGTAMQTMSTVKTADFTRLANNLQKINAIDVSGLSSVSANINHISTAFNNMGKVSSNALAIGDLAKNIAKLGNKSVQNAVANIPQLATALNGLMTTLSKSPAVSQNIIQMTNALANLSSQGSRVGSSSRSIVRGMNNTSNAMKRTTRSSTSLAAAFGKFYATWFLVIRGAKQLVNAIEGTADYIEAYNYYNVALGKIASDWSGDWEKYGYENAEAYAESFTKRLDASLNKLSGLQVTMDAEVEGTGLLTESGMKNLGLNIQEITQYASQLASVTNSVGQTGEVSIAAASAFTKLAGDISSLFNIDYSSAAQNIQSGLIGQSRALYKYGIDITNATLQTYAYNLGLEKAVSEMTQAEKMQLRMIAILDQSRVAWGDQANTLNSIANLMRQLKNNVKEAGMVLGQLFVPVLEKVLPVLNGLVIAIKRLLVSIAQLLGVKIDFDQFGQGYSDASDDIDEMSDSLDGVAKAAKKAKAGLRGFDELQVINMPEENGGTSGAGAGTIDLTADILKATAEYEKAWQEAYDRMENKAQEIADNISRYLEPVRKIFEDFAIGDYFQAGQDVSHLVAGIFNFFAEAIDRVDWYGIGKKMGDFLAGIDWTSILSSVGKFIWEGIKAALELWAGSFSTAPIETVFLSILALPAIVGFGAKIIDFVLGPFIKVGSLLSPLLSPITTGIKEMFTILSWGADTLGGAFMSVFGTVGIVTVVLAGLAAGLGYVYSKNEEVRESFAQAVSTIQEGFQPAILFITETLLPSLQAGWDRLVEILTPLGEFLQNAFTSIWQDMINPALTYIGETVLPKVTNAFENLWNNVLVPLGSLLGNVLEPIIKMVSDALSILWQNVVVPLADAVGNSLGKSFEGIIEVFNFVVQSINPVIKTMQFLWNNVFAPIVNFLTKTFKPVFESVFNSIKSIINGLSKTFGGLIDFITGVFSGNWEKAWNGVKKIFFGIWDTLSSKVKTPLNAVISLFEGLANSIIDAWNWIKEKINTLSFTIPNWIPEIGGSKFGFNFEMSDHISIPRFEEGGFPKPYSLFAAGEKGRAELLGTVGGQTAVAGGAEITGIRDAVLASHREEMELMRQQNELLRGILAKEFGITEQQIGKAAQNYSRDYMKRTGNPAYSF